MDKQQIMDYEKRQYEEDWMGTIQESGFPFFAGLLKGVQDYSIHCFPNYGDPIDMHILLESTKLDPTEIKHTLDKIIDNLMNPNKYDRPIKTHYPPVFIAIAFSENPEDSKLPQNPDYHRRVQRAIYAYLSTKFAFYHELTDTPGYDVSTFIEGNAKLKELNDRVKMAEIGLYAIVGGWVPDLKNPAESLKKFMDSSKV